jgi:hypothetical protein
MSRIVAILASLVALAAPAGAAGFASDSLGIIRFSIPSRNVGCMYFSDPERGVALACDRIAPSPLRVVLYAKGKPEVLANLDRDEVNCCAEDSDFAYGETWSEGPFTCASSAQGLDCDNGRNGFTMNRAGITTY